jgi:acetylglutamate synthase
MNQTIGKKFIVSEDINLVRVPSFDEAGPDLVRLILDDSFSSRGLRLAGDYFGVTRPSSVWIAYKEGSPAGVAVVEPVIDPRYSAHSGSQQDIAYLDKLGVVEKWQRNGVAKALWEQVAEDNPQLCLRADAASKFNRFYADRCDTRLPYEGWIVYTNGVPPIDLPKAHNYALDKPATLVKL